MTERPRLGPRLATVTLTAALLFHPPPLVGQVVDTLITTDTLGQQVVPDSAQDEQLTFHRLPDLRSGAPSGFEGSSTHGFDTSGTSIEKAIQCPSGDQARPLGEWVS